MVRGAGLDVPVIDANEAHKHASLVVEAGAYESFRAIVEPNLRAGAHVIAVSAGAPAVNLDLVDLAEEAGAKLQIANGTLPGLDIIRAAREAGIVEVQLVSTIIPDSLTHEAYVHDAGIDLAEARGRALQIFHGTARHFPRHFNVAVSLNLAGVGLDRTILEIFADGRLAGARHTILVRSPAITLEMNSQNYSSPGTIARAGSSPLRSLRP